MEINRNQRHRAVMKLRKVLGGLNGTTIGVLGLSFKPDTDDIRDSAAMEIIQLLQSEGATVCAYDPQAMDNTTKILPSLRLFENPYLVAEQADAIILVTAWNEFKQIDFTRIKVLMKKPVILDGRNLWDPAAIRKLGFTYIGIGRGSSKSEK
jgi:UDPglucose 6-dehydrogenase